MKRIVRTRCLSHSRTGCTRLVIGLWCPEHVPAWVQKVSQGRCRGSVVGVGVGRDRVLGEHAMIESSITNLVDWPWLFRDLPVLPAGYRWRVCTACGFTEGPVRRFGGGGVAVSGDSNEVGARSGAGEVLSNV